MGEELDAQIQHGHLADPSEEGEPQESDEEAQDQEAEEGQDQGARAAQAARGKVPVDEPEGELGRHHLQEGPGRHEHQQHQQPEPVGLQIPHQPQQQGVPHGVHIGLVAVEEGAGRVRHGPIVAS